MNLIKLAGEELNRKKSFSFTVLRHLCEKGLFRNADSVVTSIISKADFEAMQSEKIVEEHFHGSFPAFLAAFSARKTLTAKEIESIKALIATYEGKMTRLFIYSAGTLLTSSLLALAVLGFRALFPNAPRKYLCFLWALPVIRSLIPIRPASPFSLIPRLICAVNTPTKY